MKKGRRDELNERRKRKKFYTITRRTRGGRKRIQIWASRQKKNPRPRGRKTVTWDSLPKLKLVTALEAGRFAGWSDYETSPACGWPKREKAPPQGQDGPVIEEQSGGDTRPWYVKGSKRHGGVT